MSRSTPLQPTGGARPGDRLRGPAQTTTHPKLRQEQIRDDFSRIGYGVAITDERSIICLRSMSRECYQALIDRLRQFTAERSFSELRISGVTALRADDLENLSSGFLTRYLNGDCLDLTNIDRKFSADFSPRTTPKPEAAVASRIESLIDEISVMRRSFQILARDEDATVESVFAVIEQHNANLKDLNIDIRRPDPRGVWEKTHDTRFWAAGHLDQTGQAEGPGPTMRSMLKSDRTTFPVDTSEFLPALAQLGYCLEELPSVDDLRKDFSLLPFQPEDLQMPSFVAAGIQPSIVGILEDLRGAKTTKGSGRMLFIKMRSTFGEEAFVHVHTLVSKDRDKELPPLYPADPTEAQRVVTALDLYFAEATRAIEQIRARQKAWAVEGRAGLPIADGIGPEGTEADKPPVDTGQVYSVDRLLSPEQSRLFGYVRGGQQVSGEIMDEPMVRGHHILGTIYSFIKEVLLGGWDHFPPSFIRERFMDVSRLVLMRVGSEPASVNAAKRKVVLGKDAWWIEVGVTKRKFQRKLHLQTEAFYRLFREAFFSALAKHIASSGRFKYWNMIKALPSVIWALFYVLGWAKRPPQKLAQLRVPVGFLAVHPTSLAPFHVYVDDIYPDFHRPEKKPTADDLAVAKAFVPRGEEITFDESTFVLTGDYREIGHLIADQTKKFDDGGVLWSDDEVVNEGMLRNLHYDGQIGRDQVVVMWVTIDAFRKYFAQQRERRIQKGTEAFILNRTRGIR